MTAARQTYLQQHPAFTGISTGGQSTLIANAEKVEFKIGQAISIGNSVPNRILLITRGRARLLGNQNGRIHTLALLGESSIIGLASLLRAEGCEEASASTLIEALAIPASTILDLWESEEFFRNWCNQTLFPAEAAAILEKISEKSEDTFSDKEHPCQVLAFLEANHILKWFKYQYRQRRGYLHMQLK